jgi:arylsulfatase A-like enzyme
MRNLLLAFLFPALLLGCSGYNYVVPPVDYRIPSSVGFEGPHVVLCLVDALGQDVFDDMLRRGKLPFIKRYLVDRGVCPRPALTSLTTNTYACFPADLSGFFPGHAGIPANAWFDREKLIARLYNTPRRMRLLDGDTVVPFIFGYLPDDYTAVVLTQAHKGATRYYENYKSAGLAYFCGNDLLVDRLTTARFYDILDESAGRGEFPRVTLLYYMSEDATQHRFGVGSREAEYALEQIDVQIGEVCGVLARSGKLDRVLFVLSADHGMDGHFPGKTFDPYAFVAGLGIPSLRPDEDLDELHPTDARIRRFNACRAVVEASGFRVALIYIRGAKVVGGDLTIEPWSLRVGGDTLRDYPLSATNRVNLLEKLASSPGVGAAAWRESADEIGVMSSRGESRIARKVEGGRKLYSYRVLRGEDPLKVPKSKTCPPDGRRVQNPKSGPPFASGWHDSREWLAATACTSRPDVVAQLPELFDSPRVGDIVLFAAEGWDFLAGNRGDHGGFSAAEMRVPFIFAGPGVERLERGPARVIDLVPTLLDYLGRKPPPGAEWKFDGRSLFPETGR